MEQASSTLTRILLAPAILAASLLAAAPARASFEVVMADGQHVAASTRPVIALGHVNFHDANGRAISLAASAVDVEATREALQRELGLAPRTTWTAADLAASTVRLQVLGDGALPAEEAPGRALDGTVQAAPAGPATNAEQQRVLRERLEKLETDRRSVRAEDPRAAILAQRYQLLQTELLRLSHAPEAPLAVARQ